jgi:hypothetical protein
VMLRQQPPSDLRIGSIDQLLTWATSNWEIAPLMNCRQLASVLTQFGS